MLNNRPVPDNSFGLQCVWQIYAEVTSDSALTNTEIVEAWKEYGVLAMIYGRNM